MFIQIVRMGVEKACAKNAEVKVCAHMVGGKITAVIVVGSQSVPMVSAKIFAKNAEEVPYVVMVGSSIRAVFAVWNVLMPKRRVCANFVL